MLNELWSYEVNDMNIRQNYNSSKISRNRAIEYYLDVSSQEGGHG